MGLATRGRAREGAQDTRERVLEVAERLVQVQGFNAFSYADIASELGLTKATLHHHFQTKAALGEALIVRYAARFATALATINGGELDAPAKLAAYARLYEHVLADGRMCLCGMLAAEQETLAPPIRDAVLEFLDANETWIAEVLEQGRSEGTLHFDGPPRETAGSIVSGLEGVMLVARSYGDVSRFRRSAQRLIAGLTGAGS
jgi:TetR/AcrR family transcriptional repressor of nem operon